MMIVLNALMIILVPRIEAVPLDLEVGCPFRGKDALIDAAADDAFATRYGGTAPQHRTTDECCHH